MDHAKQLTETNVPSLLVRFSFPAILALLVGTLYNITDRIFVGHSVGTVGTAATTIAFPIMLIVMAFIMLVGGGASALIPIKLGARKHDRAELILGNSVTLFVAISITISLLGIVFLDPLLKLFGASETVIPHARVYTGIILAGTIFQSIALGMNGFIQGEGKPQIAMVTMITGFLLNILFCSIFVRLLDMGVGGSAMATVIAQAVSAGLVLHFYVSGRSTLKLRKKNLFLNKDIVSGIVALGVAPFSMQIASGALNALMNNKLHLYGGDTAISVMGILYSILALLLIPITGINQGLQPIVGHNYGARRFCRVKSALKISVATATIIAIAGYLITRLFTINLIQIFSSNNLRLAYMGYSAIVIFFKVFPVMGLQLITTTYFHAIGKTRQAMFLNLSRQLIFMIPALMLLPRFLGLKGIWYVVPVADTASAVLTGLWLVAELQQLEAKKRAS